MVKKVRLFGCWLPCFVCAVFLAAAAAQDESLEDFKYKEDYDRVQSIVKTPDVVKRAERMVTLYKDRRDMRAELRDYADNVFARDLETMMKQNNYIPMKSLCERALKVRPRFGEAYFFYGLALKREKKIDEALTAFARAYGIENPLKAKAKQQLDVTYRSKGGTLAGQEKLVKEAPAACINYDPSHFVLQQLDYVGFVRKYGSRISQNISRVRCFLSSGVPSLIFEKVIRLAPLTYIFIPRLPIN